MRGRLQFCRRSQATRNRLDPWSLPPRFSLSPSGEPSLAAYSPPAPQLPLGQVLASAPLLVVLAIGSDTVSCLTAPDATTRPRLDGLHVGDLSQRHFRFTCARALGDLKAAFDRNRDGLPRFVPAESKVVDLPSSFPYSQPIDTRVLRRSVPWFARQARGG